MSFVAQPRRLAEATGLFYVWNMNSKVDAFLKAETRWREEMAALRAIALECGLTEELKWGKPAYTFDGSNVIILQPFKEYCAILFCKGVLLKDPKKILVQMGENTQAARQIRFTRAEEITSKKAVLKAYVLAAIEIEKSGQQVTYKKTSEFAVPPELKSRLDKDPYFKAAFAALTPGRQRGYLLHFSAAKQSQTREARIEKLRPKIFAGKGFNDP